MAEAGTELISATDTTGAATAWQKGLGQLTVYGTWDGADVTLEKTPDGSTWIAVGDATTMTADGIANFELPTCTIRAKVANAGTTSLTALVSRVATRIPDGL